MSRQTAIDTALDYFDTGGFEAELARRVAVRSESQKPEGLPELHRYLDEEMIPAFEEMGFACRKYENPQAGCGPALLATRFESSEYPTVLGYGHGDVIRGLEDQWTKGAGPWVTQRDGDRLYGRGTADNKAQHTINMAAHRAVLETRGRLGFNAKFLVETGEEAGSRGLREIIESHIDDFAADVFIASDGPRAAPDRPTIFLGARGALNFDLVVDLREGGHHSGNWGGLLANPGVVLAHALATIIGRKGEIRIKEWLPPAITKSVRDALKDVTIAGGAAGPEIDLAWGEPGLSPAEQVYAWNSFDVLAFTTGNPQRPVNAIPPRARAHCQIRYVAGTDHANLLSSLRRHLDKEGFPEVVVEPPPPANAGDFIATRTDPEHPWACWVRDSMARSIGGAPAVIPSLGGSICNDLFTDLLGLPAIWVPHSYAACSQHAPNEHILMSVSRSAIEIMSGLYWDLGDGDTPGAAARQA